MAYQKAAYIRWDPATADTDISEYVKKLDPKPAKEKKDGTTLAHNQKRTEAGTPGGTIDMTIRDTADRTFFLTYVEPTYQAETEAVIGWRMKDAPVGATNPEYRAKVMTFDASTSMEALADIEYSVEWETTEMIRSIDGVAWTNYHSGDAATAF